MRLAFHLVGSCRWSQAFYDLQLRALMILREICPMPLPYRLFVEETACLGLVVSDNFGRMKGKLFGGYLGLQAGDVDFAEKCCSVLEQDTPALGSQGTPIRAGGVLLRSFLLARKGDSEGARKILKSLNLDLEVPRTIRLKAGWQEARLADSHSHACEKLEWVFTASRGFFSEGERLAVLLDLEARWRSRGGALPRNFREVGTALAATVGNTPLGRELVHRWSALVAGPVRQQPERSS